MATFFGEVLPVFSRAVDDEDDELYSELSNESERNAREVILRWGAQVRNELKLSGDNQIKCQSVIFAIGKIACEFANRYYVNINDKPVGVISCGLDATNKNSLSQDNIRDNSCFIYKLVNSDSSALVILWHHKVKPIQTFDAISKLFQYISKNVEVFILTALHISEYKTPIKEIPFVRALITDCQQKTPKIPVLDVPNIITGLPATVLQYCQVHDIRATLYVSYIESDRTDSINIEVFQSLLSVLPHSNYSETPQLAASLPNTVDKIQDNHYVYM